jgi:RNA polymerase sigma-70 factor (ECF subfamily)
MSTNLEIESSCPMGTFLLDHLDSLYRYGVCLSRNPDVARDLVQETCIRAINVASTFDYWGDLRWWSLTVLRNVWLNQQRRYETRMVTDIPSIDKLINNNCNYLDPHSVYVRTMEQEQVRKAIKRLRPHLQQIIILREYHDLTYREIAVFLNCPIGTVMSRLKRARSKLRSELSGFYKHGSEP